MIPFLHQAIAEEVSIPLRGKGTQKHATVVLASGVEPKTFPSPCGEKVVKNEQTGVVDLDSAISFPSPCGEMEL